MNSQLNLDLTGNIFNIQRYSTHDGPGIRTTVFLKGCPLRCFWCQNPESRSINPVLLFNPDLCSGCGQCVSNCENGANTRQDGKSVLNRELCKACGSCTSFCFQNARTLAGYQITIGDLLYEILKDRYVFMDSGGGVTVSGGEPAVQWEFTLEILKACRANFIHTAMETCGYADWEVMKPLVESCDFIYFDLKCIDPELHKQGTGLSNDKILINAKNIVDLGANVHFRTPLIPGYNDTEENILALKKFVEETLNLPGSSLELLRYNKLGEDKFSHIGEDDLKPQLEPQSDEYLEFLNSILA